MRIKKHLLPCFEDLFAQLKVPRVFSKIYFRPDYHQIPVQKDNIPKTAFCIGYRHYEFEIISFDFTSASTIFMDKMNHPIHEYLDTCVVVFIDDILVYSKDEKEHKKHLRLVLDVLRKQKWFTKLSKCEF